MGSHRVCSEPETEYLHFV